MDGAALTALRTAAVSRAGHAPPRRRRRPAPRDLRRRRAGAIAPGGDARRPPDRARHGRRRGRLTRAQALAEVARGLGVDAAVGGANDVADADIVCTCTTSDVPLFDGGLLAAGRARQRRGQLPTRRRESSTRSRSRGPGGGRDARRGVRRGRGAVHPDRRGRVRSRPRRRRPRGGRARRRGAHVSGRHHGLQVRRAGVRGPDRRARGGGRGRGRDDDATTADVVVVGGGVVGASTAYHLAAAGVEHVVLLERADSVGHRLDRRVRRRVPASVLQPHQHRAVARERAR